MTGTHRGPAHSPATGVLARLAKLEAARPEAEPTVDLEAEKARYGELLWHLSNRRAYGRFKDGRYHLTVVSAEGRHEITYVSLFDPAGASE